MTPPIARWAALAHGVGWGGLATLAILLAAIGCGPKDPTPGPPPNLLLLVVDCLRADRVGAGGIL